MKLEEQVVSLELAKRLAKLGVKQDSLFRWYESDTGVAVVMLEADAKANDASAFTVAELGEMLPQYIKNLKRGDFWLAIADSADLPETLESKAITFGRHQEIERTEADARAKMLIYLLENDLLKAEGKAA